MPPCCDMEISLYFVSFQTAIYPACLLVAIPPAFGGLLEFSFSFLLHDFSNYVFRVSVFLFLSLSCQVSTIQCVQSAAVHPVIPASAIFREGISG